MLHMAGALAAAEAGRQAAILELRRSLDRNGSLIRELHTAKGMAKGSGTRRDDPSRPPPGALGPDEMRLCDDALRRLYRSGFVCNACDKPSFGDEQWCGRCRRRNNWIKRVPTDFFRLDQIPTGAGGAWGGGGASGDGHQYGGRGRGSGGASSGGGGRCAESPRGG